MKNLTSEQMNIYLREEYYNGTSINNISFMYCFDKVLDIAICKKVINKIIRDNEILRTRIKIESEGPKQYVFEYEKENIDVQDFTLLKMEEVKSNMEKDAKIPICFENSKLYTFSIWKLENNKTGIYIKLHHIIGDAWSTKIILKQFNELYKFNNELGNYDLEKIYSYYDFLEEEQEYLKSDTYRKDKEYWQEYLKNISDLVQFKDISNNKETKAIRYTRQMSEEFSQRINEFCKQNKITPYLFFMAVYSIYLYKTTGKTDFCIGTPLLNRKTYIEKQTIGMFISTIPIKININEDMSIINLIKQISIDIRNSMKHQRYPFEDMKNYLKEIKNSNTNIFDTILSFQNIKPDKEYLSAEVESIWNFAGHQQSSFEMHITDYNDLGKYLFHLDLKSKIISKNEPELIYRRLEYLANDILINSDKGIKELEYIPKEELDLLDDTFNKTKESNNSKTLIELFEEQVKENYNNIAIKYRDKELTYGELSKSVNVFSNILLNKGIKENEQVVLLLDRSLEMIIAMLSVIKIGAYYIPIDPSWPEERVNYIIEDSKSNVVITDKSSNKNKENIKIIDITKEIAENKNKEIGITPNRCKIDNLCYVIYTSGSTGKPKGTLITHSNVTGLLNSTHELFKQTSNDIWTVFHTYTFDFSVWEIYGSLLYGGKLIIVEKEKTTNPKEFLELLIEEKVTILNQTPAYFYKLVEQEKLVKNINDKLRLKKVILGGESVHAEPLKYFKNKYEDIKIYNGYGPTETTIFSIMCEITKKDIEENNIYIGKPLTNYNVQILDANMKKLPIGVSGEICISGTGVCNGYLGNSKLTNEKFIFDEQKNITIYKSGDLGCFEDDGRIKYLGRNDNQVKIRGFRIEIEEIEKEILNVGDITKVVVMPIENNNYTKSLVGFIETNVPNYTVKVLDEIKKNLAPYMIPKLYQVKEFPLNDNGKIDRKKLLANIQIQARQVIRPQNKIEKELFEIISKIAKTKELSIEDDFFTDLGLDSLDIMSISTVLNIYNISIQDINDNSNIKDLANKIENGKLYEKDDLEDIKVINKIVNFDISNILLTGSTGFLGSHILRDLINNDKVKKVYCLIRSKNNISSKIRMEKRIKEYFDQKDFKYIDKIEVLDGDLEKENLGLAEDIYSNIGNKITTIIHSAANVKHYGKYMSFYKTNVVGTKNILNFAKVNNSKLAHISTVSIGGYSNITDIKVLDENNLKIGQQFYNHVYMKTKYEAEKEVLKELGNNNIEGKIFRLGNIMPRYSDGKFQLNELENGFINRLNTIIKTKTITDIHSNYSIDLSPVDLCAKAIINLLERNNYQTIYHIFNNNTIKVKDIIKELDINKISVAEQIKKISEGNSPLDAQLLSDLNNTCIVESRVTNLLSIEQLNSNGFIWNKIDGKYINYILKIINRREE